MNNVFVILRFITLYGLPALKQIVELCYQTTEPTKEQWDSFWTLAETPLYNPGVKPNK